MVHKTAKEYRELLERMLMAAGADEANARCVAAHLVASELAGVETHGVRPMEHYIQSIESGELKPAARPEILQETDNSALISGNWGWGHVAAEFGVNVAIAKAQATRIAIVSLVQLHHIGRVGHYGELAAAQDMVAITAGAGYCVNRRRAVPYGGREKLLDTNPFSVAFPNPKEPDRRPVLLDYATTFRAQGALQLMAQRDQPAPPGFVIDKEGQPSIDANELALDGAMLPFGTHKGYALMMAVEYLGRMISGSDDYADKGDGGDDMFGHQGVTMIVFRADLFRSQDSYNDAAWKMAQSARAVAPAPGFDRVRMPGDPEADTRARRRAETIPIADDLWAMLEEQGVKVGVRLEA